MGNKLVIGQNDLASQFPREAAFFDEELNGRTAFDVHARSNKKFWWRCDNGLNHKYLMCPNNETTRNSGCPICSGQLLYKGFNDLETVYPEIAKAWDYEKNTGKPSDYRHGSGYKAWWVCKKCDLSYQSPINVHVQGHGCPYCAGQKIMPRINDLQTLFPDVAAEYADNNEVPVNMISPGTHKKVRWQCPECGCIYEASPHHRTSKDRTGCPNCKRPSKGERAVKAVLDKFHIDYGQQTTFDDLVGDAGHRLRYDFTVYRNGEWIGVIEFNGQQHYKAIECFGGDKAFERQGQRDYLKVYHCVKHKIPILWIAYADNRMSTEEMVIAFLVNLKLIDKEYKERIAYYAD